jgi:chromate transport protein ChrA
MNFTDRKLYHQIHPVKLFIDVAVTPVAIYFLWHHRIWPAILVAFLPPILVSAVMLIWPPDSLERIRASSAGKYLKSYMTPAVEAIRFLILIPVAYGAWTHELWPIWIGLVILVLAWMNGFVIPRRSLDSPPKI